MVRPTRIQLAISMVAALAVPTGLLGQNGTPELKAGIVVGTVIDVNSDPVPNATVELKSSDNSDSRTVVTRENGFFEFHDLKPRVPCEINIRARDFADWTSPAITLDPGQFKIVTGIQLRIKPQVTHVDVTYDPVEVATEQLKIEEKQRAFGFLPNYYVSYETNPAPLTPKMKFELAWKVAIDPVTAAGVGVVAASKQAANSPKYGQGWGTFGERFGSVAADGFTDIMIGGAILPSLLHQDPRYFYQGNGTAGSRIRHAIFSSFVARGDDGRCQPNYSSIGGDLAASGLANLYYPEANRGARLLFANFAIGTAERIGASLAQEFVFGKITRRSGHMK